MCPPNHPRSSLEPEEREVPLVLPPDDALPRYTPEELAAVFLDFYQFLTTLHYKPKNLKVPPPEGWGDEVHTYGKSDLAVEVLRRLPYFNSDETTAIHYKSSLLGYTTLPHDYFADSWMDTADDYYDFMREDRAVDPTDVVFIATGYESGGCQFLLDVNRGEISVDVIRCELFAGVDVKEFFDALKEEYRSLRVIPYEGCVSMEAENVSECDEEITEEEVCAQSEYWWSELDAQYVRQMYRSYGWPDAFRREEAFKAIEGLNESMREAGRDEWWEYQNN